MTREKRGFVNIQGYNKGEHLGTITQNDNTGFRGYRLDHFQVTADITNTKELAHFINILLEIAPCFTDEGKQPRHYNPDELKINPIKTISRDEEI